MSGLAERVIFLIALLVLSLSAVRDARAESCKQSLKIIFPENFYLKLPRYQWSGTREARPGIPGAEEWIRDNPITLPKRLTNSEKTETVASEMILAIREYMTRRLGLDPSARLPNPQQFYFVEDNEYKEWRTALELPGRSDGTNDWHSNIFVRDAFGKENSYSIANHELVHLGGLTEISISLLEKRETGGTYNVSRARSGFHVNFNNDFNQLNEGVTELTNLHMMTTEWKKYPTLRSIYPKVSIVSYYSTVLVIDLIIDDWAKRTGQTYDQVLQRLQSSYITGDDFALKEIERVYGARALNALRTFREESIENSRTVARTFGVLEPFMVRMNSGISISSKMLKLFDSKK